jgi:thymidine kinase
MQQKKDQVKKLFGTVEGITGPMASGKTTEFCQLVSSLRALEHKGLYKVVVVKPSFDNRPFSPGDDPGSEIIARSDDKSILAKLKGVYSVNNSAELGELLEQKMAETDVKRHVLAISEIQFFDSGIVDLISHLSRNCFVLWEGLTLNFRGESFDFADFTKSMDDLVSITHKLVVRDSNAICDVDGSTYAQFTQRLTPEGEPDPWYAPLRQVGAQEYEARCAEHHLVPYRQDATHVRQSLLAVGRSGMQLADFMAIYSHLNTPVTVVESILAALERERKLERNRHRQVIDRIGLEEEFEELSDQRLENLEERIPPALQQRAEEIYNTLKFWQDDVVHATKYLRI